MAYDESYLDSTNLRSKLQQHLAFDSELTENEKRLNTVEQEGEDFIQKEHFMKDQVGAQLAELRSGWDELRTKSALKTQRLREAYETTNLQRKVEDIEKWLDKIEAELSSEDHGRDIVSVEHLLKKLDKVEAQVQGRKDAVNDVVNKARQLRVTGSAATDQLLNEVGNIQARYNHLEEPISIRRENLKDARQLFEWITGAEEELDWLNAKIPLAQSQNFGDSLQAASSLQKKHVALEKELQIHQTSVQEIESKGQDMIRQRHFAASTIQDILDRLGSALLSIKNACNERSERLTAAVAAQEYLAEVAESEQWIR
jgi:DNA repair exonuclease SbcCD ATPase subunit